MLTLVKYGANLGNFQLMTIPIATGVVRKSSDKDILL